MAEDKWERRENKKNHAPRRFKDYDSRKIKDKKKKDKSSIRYLEEAE